MAERDVALAPPGRQGGGNADIRDGRPHGVLIVTHTPSRDALGTRLEIPMRGLVVGGSGTDFRVDGAQETGSQLEIRWVGPPTNGRREWRADAVGRVAFNWGTETHRMLDSGDDIRVVDTFFRFLCGRDLQERFHEAIYHMTILDMPTGLANARYLREVMDREASRAVKRRAPIAIVTLQLEPPTAGSSHASHDLVQTVAQRVRSGMPRDWFAARAADLEVVVVAPETSRENAEHQARGWLQSCSSTTTPALALGVAEFGGDLQDATVVLAAARANAKRYQSSG